MGDESDGSRSEEGCIRRWFRGCAGSGEWKWSRVGKVGIEGVGDWEMRGWELGWELGSWEWIAIGV